MVDDFVVDVKKLLGDIQFYLKNDRLVRISQAINDFEDKHVEVLELE